MRCDVKKSPKPIHVVTMCIAAVLLAGCACNLGLPIPHCQALCLRGGWVLLPWIGTCRMDRQCEAECEANQAEGAQP